MFKLIVRLVTQEFTSRLNLVVVRVEVRVTGTVTVRVTLRIGVRGLR